MKLMSVSYWWLCGWYKGGVAGSLINYVRLSPLETLICGGLKAIGSQFFMAHSLRRKQGQDKIN